MIQGNLRKYLNKIPTKTLSCVLGGFLCVLGLISPFAVVGAGASGEDIEAPPIGVAGDNYVKGLPATFFYAQGMRSTGYNAENAYCSLALQDNFVSPGASGSSYNETYYIPDGQGYSYKYGDWLCESLGDGANRPWAHTIQGQLRCTDYTAGGYWECGLAMAGVWVEIDSFLAYLNNSQFTVLRIKDGVTQEVVESQGVCRLVYAGLNGEEISRYATITERANGSHDITFDNPPTANHTVNGRGYVFVYSLDLRFNFPADDVGSFYRVRFNKTNIAPDGQYLSYYDYCEDTQRLYGDILGERQTVGRLFGDSVRDFFETEILPDFSFGSLLLVCLGVCVLVLFIKLALGG